VKELLETAKVEDNPNMGGDVLKICVNDWPLDLSTNITRLEIYHT
jgi:hypothetical protein